MAMAAYIIGMKKLQRSLLQEKELLSRDFWSSSRMTGNSEISGLKKKNGRSRFHPEISRCGCL
jgi:hypothetical protein